MLCNSPTLQPGLSCSSLTRSTAAGLFMTPSEVSDSKLDTRTVGQLPTSHPGSETPQPEPIENLCDSLTVTVSTFFLKKYKILGMGHRHMGHDALRACLGLNVATCKLLILISKFFTRFDPPAEKKKGGSSGYVVRDLNQGPPEGAS